MNPSSAHTPDRAGLAPFSVDRIVQAIRDVIGERNGVVPLHEPCFRGREWEYVKECLDSGWVSTAAEYGTRFERQLVETTGSPHAIATSSGTAALHTCLMLAGVGRDDEVLMPSLSFVATANAVAYTGATPHFVDIETATLGLDPALLERHLDEIAVVRDGACVNRRSGRRLAAVVAVHMFGHPCRIDAIAEVAARFGLTVIEDAAESLGSLYRGRHTGCWGALAAVSFNGNKTITTGGGGAVLTADPSLATLARHVTTTAKVPHRWEARHDRVGYNYRLPSLNAALGCAQLEQLSRFVHSKRELARRYGDAFAAIDGVRFVEEPVGSRSNYWLCTLLLADERAAALEPLLERTHEHGILTRRAWHPLSELPMYAACPRTDLAITQSVARRLINLPSSPGLLLDSTRER